MLVIFSIFFQFNKNSLNTFPQSGNIIDVIVGKKTLFESRIIQQFIIKDFPKIELSYEKIIYTAGFTILYFSS